MKTNHTPRRVPFKESFAHIYPGWLGYWDHTQNTVNPETLSPRNSYKAHWICPVCSYSWVASVNNITRRGDNPTCLFCAGKILIPGRNDVKTTHPGVVDWWDSGNTVTPEMISKGSTKQVRFICEQGHRFTQQMKRFNFHCQECVVEKKSIHMLAPSLVEEWHPDNPLNPREVSYNSARTIKWVCRTCTHVWETPAYQRVNGTGCPVCAKETYVSKAEQQLKRWVEGLLPGFDVINHDTSVLHGQELDIYIPGKNLAIEFNGLYWHSEAQGKHRTYHYNKWLQCKNQGIQLVQIWEDDWNRNPELVKRMLAHKLKVASTSKLYARNLTVGTITYKEAAEFLEANHIQGSVPGSFYSGLLNPATNQVVAVSVWSVHGKQLHLDRYATSVQVVGGLGKLLKAVASSFPNMEEVVTFADHCVSDGGLYEKLGFTPDKELPPDYSYVVGGRREHKFNYRLKKFRDDPNLLFQEGLSEQELAVLNKLGRVWDAGKTRFKLKIK